MFTGFTETDFDAYAPQKWSSHAYNRQRLEIKEKLLALAKDLQFNNPDNLLACEASAEHPTLWNQKRVDSAQLIFFRDAQAKKELDQLMSRSQQMSELLNDPTRKHVFLSLRINQELLTVALRLHPEARIDRQNLEKKMHDEWEKQTFLGLLQELPDSHQVWIEGGKPHNAHTVSDQSFAAIYGEFIGPQASWLCIGTGLPRQVAVGTPPDVLTQHCHKELLALLPLYRFVAWTKNNDFLRLKESLKQEKQHRAQKGLAIKDHVRILRGLFAGRRGIVSELDHKGAVRVQVGKLSVKVAIHDVDRVD